MIISGGSRSNWRFFAKHLMKTEENERVHVVEIRGLIGKNVHDAFREIDALAMGTQVTNSFYHADINPREGECLTEEQWTQAIDTLERKLGLQGQARLVVEHEKEGRVHRHVVWSRIDLDTLKAIPDSFDYKRHQQTSRELEKAFGLEPVNGVLGPDGKRVERRPKNWEVLRGSQSRIDPNAVTAELTALWHQADSGQAFAAALAERGYILAKGDRRDFVVVDQAGDEHSLARRVTGAKAADIRARLKDVDRDALPSVKEARALARERAAQQEAAPDASPQPDPAPPLADPAKARDTSRTLQAVAEEVLHTAKDAIAGKEGAAPSPADIRRPEPARQSTPRVDPQASVFERFARKLTEAVRASVGGPTAAESIDPARQPAAPPSGLPGNPSSDPFERLVTEALRDAKATAPIAEELAVPVAAALEHHGASLPEFSSFDRLTEARFEAIPHAGGDGLFLSEGFAWRAAQGHAPLLPEAHPEGELTAFERATQEKFAATRDNGGQTVTADGHSFWRRAVDVIAEARDRALEWIKQTAKGFADRLSGERTDRDNERER